MTTEDRSISTIAQEILGLWKPVNFAAVPYLKAMSSLDRISDSFGLDSGRMIVAYFLSNAAGWRGPDAKRIKLELNTMLKSQDRLG